MALVLLGFTGIRCGELVGLETRYLRPASMRVEWQLSELDTGELHRCPPKGDSHRTVALPDWLAAMVPDHIGRVCPTACACHGLTYVFRGYGVANGAARRPGAKLVDVAWRRSGFATWLFQPAATGWRPKATPYPPVRCRFSASRGRGCLCALWTAALDARRAMSPGSPVAVLDRPLRRRAVGAGE